MRRVWLQPFSAGEAVGWRAADDLPPAAVLVSSPHDPEARSSKKRATEWPGSQVQLTETCADDLPQLITDVATTPATTVDHAVTAAVQDRLAARDLVPSEHRVDTTDVTADHLVTSQTEPEGPRVGPVHEDSSWQAREQTGYAVAQFVIDWAAKRATCPSGKQSRMWTPGTASAGHEIVRIRWAPADGHGGRVRTRCVGHDRPRVLQVRPRQRFEALMAARSRQTTEAFKGQSARRAGIEGPLSQGGRRSSLRRARSVGLATTALSHVFIATALNVVRLAAWLADVPRAAPRRSAFAALAPGVT